jgi:hypothetical protein
MPMTLKFADAVGEMLTAGPIKYVPPLPFGHYTWADGLLLYLNDLT